jgi:hypothetical protein
MRRMFVVDGSIAIDLVRRGEGRRRKAAILVSARVVFSRDFGRLISRDFGL